MLIYKITAILFTLSLACLLFPGCTPKIPETVEVVKDSWNIHPKSTVLKKQSQFVISGKNLFAAEIITGESVSVGKYSISPNGRTLKVYLTVNPLQSDSSGKNRDSIDDPGTRLIQIRTLETLKELTIFITGEKDPE